MDIVNAKTAKEKLEQSIAELIVGFETDTGAMVNEIIIVKIGNSRCTSLNIISVKARVEL